MNVIREAFKAFCVIRFGDERNLMAADPVLYGQMLEIFAAAFTQGAGACNRVHRVGNPILPARFEAQIKKDLADIAKSLDELAERLGKR